MSDVKRYRTFLLHRDGVVFTDGGKLNADEAFDVVLATDYDTLLEQARRLREWVEEAKHDRKCIRSRWQAGRPTKDGRDYELMFGNKWYPSDQLPECTCGLGSLLAETRWMEEASDG